MARKKKTDTEIIFPERKFTLSIGEVEVHPFTYGDFIDLSPVFEKLLNELKYRGIFINIDTFAFTMPEMLSFYFAMAPFLAPIMAKATKLDEANIRDLQPLEAITIITTVIALNEDTLKNFFGLFYEVKNLTVNQVQAQSEEGKENQEIT